MNASRWSTLLTPALVGAAGLVLAACSTDRPTGLTAVDTKPQTFSVTNGDMVAARAMTSKNKIFATIPILEAKLQGEGAGAAVRKNLVQSPWDLTWNGGPTIKKATQWNIYINCSTTPAGCWGTGSLTPKTFLQAEQASGMMEIPAQYLGEDPTGKFATVNELNANVAIPFDSSTGAPTVDGNLLNAILHAASLFTGKSGYDQIYHVFLPSGVDMCDAPGDCYSPNNPSTFAFCAFHGFADFDNTGHYHVLYTMEPYQFVGGCSLPVQSRQIDGTSSTLSHEFTELITDPDLDAWFNDLTGNEIADLCFTFRNLENLAGTQYVVQEEYSNAAHACTDETHP